MKDRIQMIEGAGTRRRAVRFSDTNMLVSARGVCLLVSLAFFASLFVDTLPAQEKSARLRWSNGDLLPGRLLESEAGQIRWFSPIFAEDLVVNASVLQSIVFPKQTVQPSEAFRIGTVTGDVFTANLVGSDEDAILVSSKRQGQFRLNRDAIYSLNRIRNPNLVFDGSQFKDWAVPLNGLIKDLSYKAYKGNWARAARFPDLSRLTPVEEGRFGAGYIDPGLPGVKGRMAVAFEGHLDIKSSGEHRFNLWADDQSRLFIDGRLVVEYLGNGKDQGADGNFKDVFLSKGFHALRVEFLGLGGAFRLVAGMIGPDFKSLSLVGKNQASAWHRGPGGHPKTDRQKSSVFRAVVVPNQFELDLELISSESPRFVLALGKDKLSAESNQSLRLETWGNELVVVQDPVFEPVMTIEDHQRDVRIRLVFDNESSVLEVFDANGRSLVAVKDIQATTGESGIYIRNRGEDLTIRRLSVYRQSSEVVRQTVFSTKARVHLIDGQVIYGQLYVEDGSAFVLNEEGQRRDVELALVDRIARPDVSLLGPTEQAELSFNDGAVVHGKVMQVTTEAVALNTAYSDSPVLWNLSGALTLQFGRSQSERKTRDHDNDQLFTTSGRLRGQLSFDVTEFSLAWRPAGADKPLRLSSVGAFRVERGSNSLPGGFSYDDREFPMLVHLLNGERFPCLVSSYDETYLVFKSPFIKGKQIESVTIKAIEFSPPKRSDSANKSSRERDDWLTDILGLDPETSRLVDPVKFDRALIVPRFYRDSPFSHILMARNGDLKRGKLLSIVGETLQFESKLRKMSVPLARLSRVVQVGKEDGDQDQPVRQSMELEGEVRATLTDGSVLVFEAVESKEDRLFGQSDIYGPMSIPIDSILDLNSGGFEPEKYKYLFEKWVVKPAKEPEYGIVPTGKDKK